jgi:BirA family biotin operon repressor/biotin-[acetyl-CoA-carboxylase] ligase
LRAALGAIGVSAPVRAEEVTGSTNGLALALASEGAPEWTLVSAAHQTEGRGRQGRTWEDVVSGALLFSFVLRPTIRPTEAGSLALLAGASIAEAIAEITGEDVRCKWPNDLLLEDAKVGGILLEAGVDDGALRHVVVGVGVNLLAPAGVKGAGAIGARADEAAILTAFLRRFADGYRADARSARARAAWLGRNATIGRTVRATTTSGEEVVGEATGLAEDGALQVTTSDGVVEVGFGEIEHLRPA